MLVLGVEPSAPASERLSSVTGRVGNTYLKGPPGYFHSCAESAVVEISAVHSRHAVGSAALSLVQSHQSSHSEVSV